MSSPLLILPPEGSTWSDSYLSGGDDATLRELVNDDAPRIFEEVRNDVHVIHRPVDLEGMNLQQIQIVCADYMRAGINNCYLC